jgi:hypothetical protein
MIETRTIVKKDLVTKHVNEINGVKSVNNLMTMMK